MIVKGVEKKENNMVSLVLEFTKEEFEGALQRAYLKNKKKIAVPGFRKGKAPRMVVEGMYGSEVFYDDAINDISPDAFDKAVEQESLRVVGRPTITDMNVSDDKELTLTIETAIYPEVTLGEYKGLEAPKKEVQVAETDVDAEVNQVRERNARQVTVERAAENGDTVVIDFEGFMDGTPFEGGKGEDHSLELGSGQFVPGFEEQVVGMTAGEEKDIPITFPENYHAELAGKDVIFKVKAKEVKVKELPELDDEFAKDVSEFDTLEAYKEDVKKNLLEAREKSATDEFHKALIQKACEGMTVEIPEPMIDEEMASSMRELSQNLAMQGMRLEDYLQMTGMDLETFRASSRPSVIGKIKTQLLLEKVAEVEDISVNEEETEAEFNQLAEQYNMELSKIKEAITADDLQNSIRLEKAAQVIYNTGVATAPVEEKEEAAE